MAVVSAKKSLPSKTVAGKSIPGKYIPGKSLPKKSPMKSTTSASVNNSPKKQGKKVNGAVPGDPNTMGCYMTLPPCTHLTKVLNSNSKDAVLKTYAAGMKIVAIGLHADKTIGRNSVTSPASKMKYLDQRGDAVNITLLQKIRSKILHCKDCKEAHMNQHNNLYMCLQCTNIGCQSEKHAYMHARNSGHVFGIDPNTGEMICFKCGDLVSHPMLEYIRINSIRSSGLLQDLPGLPYFEIEHDLQKRSLIEKSTRIPSFKETTGLRGLINLGSTCFMSSVLQTLIHNPFLKRYYLSGSHTDCPKDHSECMSCCLNNIFQDFFTNPAVSGYGLTSFIEAAWKVKRNLAGYSEQDAHEFWQFLIHQIHKNDILSTKYIRNKESTPALENSKKSLQPFQSHISHCDCIIHKIFSGTLESTLTCTVCNKSRKIHDPMLDVSLEIQDKLNNEKVSLGDLHSCFRKYTRVEELDVLHECTSCNKRTKVTKSLRLNKLPPVLGIQLKRFEHIGISSKIDYHIEVPSILDVKEYVSDATYPNQITTYELFGIICHLGNVNTGHYLAYVKTADSLWFKFDDGTVTRVSEKEVKKVNGYMLFYCINDNF